MARRSKRRSKHNRGKRKAKAQRRSDASPSLPQLLNAPDDQLAGMDIAVANLLCASELPGAGLLQVDRYIDWLDEAARKVHAETGRNYYKFLDDPGAFECSQARFCMVCLVTVLQQQCGVRYNPKWKGLTPDRDIPDSFGVDASDVFIHAIIAGLGGTCGSLPVLYVAVGRRLGYPLKIVKAARHLFVRWDDPDGEQWFHAERFNVEATGPGIHFLPDEHYRTWPHRIAEEDIEAGIYLRSLTPREELAEFMATRGYCLARNGHINDAIDALTEASRLAPHNGHFAASQKALRIHQSMRRRGHAFANAPVLRMDREADDPFWIDGQGGAKILVQIVSPVRRPFTMPPNVGRRLMRQTLLTPNCLHVEVWLPVHEHHAAMTTHWITLSDGRHALIHKPATSSWQNIESVPNRADDQRIGQTIVPEPSHGIAASFMHTRQVREIEQLPMHEQSLLAWKIQQAELSMQKLHNEPEMPQLPLLAIPAGPAAPRLPA